MARSNTKYYRQIARGVLRWYLELDDSVVERLCSVGAVLNYQIDVELALRQLTEPEQEVLLLVHRDGVTAGDALRLAGVNHTRPDEYVTAVEVKLGRELQRRRLDDLVAYLNG